MLFQYMLCIIYVQYVLSRALLFQHVYGKFFLIAHLIL